MVNGVMFYLVNGSKRAFAGYKLKLEKNSLSGLLFSVRCSDWRVGSQVQGAAECGVHFSHAERGQCTDFRSHQPRRVERPDLEA
jgi:hypothetical protein